MDAFTLLDGKRLLDLNILASEIGISYCCNEILTLTFPGTRQHSSLHYFSASTHEGSDTQLRPRKAVEDQYPFMAHHL